MFKVTNLGGTHGYQIASINLKLLMQGYNYWDQVSRVMLIGSKLTLLCPQLDQDVLLEKKTQEV